MVPNKEKIMASAYHILMCEDVTAPTGVSTFTAQDTKVLPSTATDFILISLHAGIMLSAISPLFATSTLLYIFNH